MHVERLNDDGDEALRTVGGRCVASTDPGGIWLRDDIYTRDQLRELLPHLVAWAETGSLEARDERR